MAPRLEDRPDRESQSRLARFILRSQPLTFGQSSELGPRFRGDDGMTDKLILHEHPVSGNCYKIRLTAALPGIRMERVEYDIMIGETSTPAFLAHHHPVGRIPVLHIDRESYRDRMCNSVH